MDRVEKHLSKSSERDSIVGIRVRNGHKRNGRYLWLGKNIRRFRLVLEMTQAEAAEAVAVDQRTWSRWESGVTAPSVDQLMPICKTLGVDLPVLFGDRWTGHRM
jgi:DNA-binding XRE family transcriptional regulator